MKAVIYTSKKIRGIEDAMPAGISCDVVYDKNLAFDRQIVWSNNHAGIRKPEFVLKWSSIHPVEGYDFVGIMVDKKKFKIRKRLYGIARKSEGKFQVFYSTKRRALDTIKHELIHLKAHKLGLEDRLHFLLKQGKTLDEVDALLEPKVIKGPQPLVKRLSQDLIDLAKFTGLDIRITSFYRSNEEQDKLYAQVPKVTNAKGGESLHNYGVAFDIVERKRGYKLTKKEWRRLGYMWEILTEYRTGMKGTWGGSWVSFVDKPHMQLTLGYSLKDFQTGKVDYTRFK